MEEINGLKSIEVSYFILFISKLLILSFVFSSR